MPKDIDIFSKTYDPKKIGIGDFEFPHIEKDKKSAHLFDLSSHKRAKEAIEFGLKLRNDGFHIFVVGEDRSGRMTSTLEYLKEYVKDLPAPDDWIYLNNFKKNHRPTPFRLPNGTACKLAKFNKDHIQSIESLLKKQFTSPSYLKQIDKISHQLDQQVHDELSKIYAFAEESGFLITQTPDGFHIQEIDHEEEQDTEDKKDKKGKKKTEENGKTKRRGRDTKAAQIKDQLNRLTLTASLASRNILKQIKDLQTELAKAVTKSLWQKYRSEFGKTLGPWIDDFEADVLENIDIFLEEDDQKGRNHFERYEINIFVNNKKYQYPRVMLEARPNFENLFGSIKNRVSVSGAYETNFTMVRPGALHLANGGILVLRAEAIAKDPEVWEYLKACLRDRQVRVQEHYREQHGPLLIDSPKPKPIPLDIQVFIIGQPAWYYSFFFSDPDFRIYFKIKADIDPDLDATADNVKTYCKLIDQTAKEHFNLSLTKEAAHYLARCSTRWAEHRKKLSGRFELISDVLAESTAYAHEEGVETIQKEHIRKTLLGRRKRNSRVQERVYDDIQSGSIHIDTQNSKIGQVNGLTVVSVGDHTFGVPARISARTFIGEHGVINIERLTDMSGPIQQKGTFILDGFLSSVFAQKFPISFNCSLTFEQNYSDVEGDSASLAELCAILSSLSNTPLNQSIAITGSVDQFGEAQVVGGIHHKIEGFFDICERHGFTGKQGVIIPLANAENLTVKDEVVDAVKAKLFHIWCIKDIDEALGILTGEQSTIQNTWWGIKRTGVYKRAYDTLKSYNRILKG